MKGNRVGALRAGLTVVATLMALGSAAAAQTGGGGMRVYIDPESGARTSAPPAAAAAQGAGSAPAGDALVEEVNPEGGYVINLQRRFRGEMAARANASGEVSVGCETGASPSVEK